MTNPTPSPDHLLSACLDRMARLVQTNEQSDALNVIRNALVSAAEQLATAERTIAELSESRDFYRRTKLDAEKNRDQLAEKCLKLVAENERLAQLNENLK